MSVNRNQLLVTINTTLDELCALKASDLLLDPDTRTVDGTPTHEEVRNLLPTLKARLENSQQTGKRIYGLEKAMANLAAIASTEVVVGYGFISPRAAGNIYLSSGDGKVLGATIVDR